MILLGRLLARLVGIVLLALIAAAGGVAAVFCISGGHGTLSLARLADHLRLPALRGDVHAFLGQITASGSVAVIALLAGIGAVLVGLVLLSGVWQRPRPRRIVLGHTELGALGALGRPLRHTLATHAVDSRELNRASARVKANKRRDGGRARIRVRGTVGITRKAARERAQTAVAPVTDQLPLKVSYRARTATRHQRKAARA